MKFGKSVCIINVGGTKYAFPKDVIKDFPLRRVSRLHSCASEREVLEVCDDYDRERNEFFFDRHSEAFGFIMLYVKYWQTALRPAYVRAVVLQRDDLLGFGKLSSGVLLPAETRRPHVRHVHALHRRAPQNGRWIQYGCIVKREEGLKVAGANAQDFRGAHLLPGRANFGVRVGDFCHCVHGNTFREHSSWLEKCREQHRGRAQVHRIFRAFIRVCMSSFLNKLHNFLWDFSGKNIPHGGVLVFKTARRHAGTSWFCWVRCIPVSTYIADPGTTF